MAKRKPPLSTVVAFMSEEAQDQLREQAGVLSPLPLTAVLPDPEQPRQLLPNELMQMVITGEMSPVEAIQTWQERAETKAAAPSLQRNFQELQRLADSIAQHGLINPISVRRAPSRLKLPEGVQYLIITGERRYWAHVLLQVQERTIQEGVETREPDRIKATIASEGISVRAHQIIENLLREDIDAAEKASGFAALRNELSGRDASSGEGEVNHGSPLVSWTQVEKTLGISKRYRIYVTSILQLSDEAQTIIREHGLSERMVRPVSQKLKAYPELQARALQQIASWQQESEAEGGTSRAVTVSAEKLVDRLLAREESKGQKQEPSSEQRADPVQIHGRVKSLLKLLDQLSEAQWEALVTSLANNKANANIVADLQTLEERLSTILDGVDTQGDG